MSSFSIASLRLWICALSWLPSLVVTLAAMTGRDTPHARPSDAFDGTNTYGTFCRCCEVCVRVRVLWGCQHYPRQRRRSTPQ